MIKLFKIEDILTITTGVRLCDEFDGVKRLTAFLHGDPDGAVYTLTMADLRPESAKRLIRQHPQLAGKPNAEKPNKDDWREWLRCEKERLGAALPVELGTPIEE